MRSAQFLRGLFPRLAFIPVQSEVALEKVVYVNNPRASGYELVRSTQQPKVVLLESVFQHMGHMTNVVYQQSSGSRLITLSPPEYCQDCPELQVPMDEGDSREYLVKLTTVLRDHLDYTNGIIIKRYSQPKRDLLHFNIMAIPCHVCN